MFGRRIRTKLPQLPHNFNMDEDVRDHDKLQKEKGRMAADSKRQARDSVIEIGDRVLVKRMRKENKLSSTFAPEEYIVVRKSGADTTVRSAQDGKEYRRNIADLKRIEPEEQQQPAQGDNEKADSLARDEGESHRHIDPVPLEERPSGSKRKRKEPVKFLDYIPH
nr:uncharacterized protein LOC115257345 [Aedes albopictus]